MKLTFVDQLRLYRTPDGSVWGRGGGRYTYYSRFLETFDWIEVVTRIEPIPAPMQGMELCDGPGVSFISPPLYIGPWQYARAIAGLRKFLRDLYSPESAYLFRVPAQLSFDFAEVLRRKQHPFGLLVVADPHGDFSPGAARTVLRPYLRWRFGRVLRTLCQEADACAYVTERALQRRYPSSAGAGIHGVSDVEITEGWLREEPRDIRLSPALPSVISVGSLANMAKGADILIDSLASLARQGRPVSATFVGEGKHKAELVQRVARVGLAKHVSFAGESTREELLERLDRADLFVMASRTEGMPRALLEAMARALPCVTTSVGGMPEVVAQGDMVPPEDPRALAAKLVEVLSRAARLSEMSRRNLNTARTFGGELLRQRHREFHLRLKLRTSEWHSARRT